MDILKIIIKNTYDEKDKNLTVKVVVISFNEKKQKFYSTTSC